MLPDASLEAYKQHKTDERTGHKPKLLGGLYFRLREARPGSRVVTAEASLNCRWTDHRQRGQRAAPSGAEGAEVELGRGCGGRRAEDRLRELAEKMPPSRGRAALEAEDDEVVERVAVSRAAFLKGRGIDDDDDVGF